MSLANLNPIVIAIGGAGIKIAARLKGDALPSMGYLGVDVDAAAAPLEVIGVGDEMLKTFGSGGDIDVVRRAALGNLPEIEKRIEGNRVVYLVAGLGGGTGSALVQPIAEKAVKAGKLVVAFAATPFSAEGTKRMALAKDALSELRGTGCCVLTVPNEILLRNAPSGSTAADAIKLSDHSIALAIRGFSSIFGAAEINETEFDRLRQVLCGRNAKTLFACVEVSGEQSLGRLFPEIVACPLLHAYDNARSADHLVVGVRASADIPLKDIQAIAARLAEKFGARGEKITAISVDNSWTQPQLQVLLLGQPDPEIRKKQNAAAQAVAQAAKAMKAKLPASAQTEFGFNFPLDQRGIFDGTDPNIYRGEDVDIPTYVRRNVRVVL
jgi:cell division protein FtsZ